MTKDQFYAADARRRHSPEILLGPHWRDGSPTRRFSLHWLESTGELVLMRHPDEVPDEVTTVGSGLLGLVTSWSLELKSRFLGQSWNVEVLGTFASIAAVDQLLVGWEEAQHQHDGVRWLRDRLDAATGRED